MMDVSIILYMMNGKQNNKLTKQNNYGSKYTTHASVFRT